MTWETKWLGEAPATPNPSVVTKFENHDVGTTRQIQRPKKLKIMCRQGMQLSDRGGAACVQGRGRAERQQGDGRKELEDGSKIPVVSWDCCFLGARNRVSEAEVEERGDSQVLVMHD